MSKLKLKTVLGALNIPVGTTTTTTCPVCTGKKLSVTNNDGSGYLYNCFRASCGFKGYLPLTSDGSLSLGAPIAPPAGYTPYRGSLYALTLGERQFLAERIGFRGWHIGKSGVKVSIQPPHETLRFAFPIFGANGEVKGHTLRSYDPGVRTKALTSLNSPWNTKSSWYTESNEWITHRAMDATPHPVWAHLSNYTVVLVEDIPSAVRLSMYTNSIALLGTTLDEADVGDIAQQYTDVIVALDNDATLAAGKLAARLRLSGLGAHVEILEKDVKDMQEPELMDTIAGWGNE